MIIIELSATTWSSLMIYVHHYVNLDNVYLYDKYYESICGFYDWWFLCDHVRLLLWLVYIILGLMYAYPYFTIGVYDGHRDDDMLVNRITEGGYGYVYVFLEWHVISVKVKYIVSYLGWLVSLNWCMCECVYLMPWHRILNSLTLVCMNNMRP